MPLTATVGQALGFPVKDSGNLTLSTSQALSSSATTHIAVDVSSGNVLAVSIKKFGTITNDCTLTLQLSHDGGTNFFDFKTYANAAITATNGIYDSIPGVKATHARFLLSAGTMTGANGFNTRMYM